jgi:hypothetical protein
MTGGLIFAVLLVFSFFTSRLGRRKTVKPEQDTGLAIVEFGQAFPNEAIRSLHATADGGAIFVRLHDNKTGFMRDMGNHFSCHVIEPGGVRVNGALGGHGFAVEFLEFPAHSGEYRFANAQEAAEVSLWLLGNYVSHGDKVAVLGSPGRD